MIRIILLLSLILLKGIFAFGQKSDTSLVEKRLNVFPIWTHHHKNTNIHGVSIGLWNIGDPIKVTNTNGIKIELIGLGLFTPLMPQAPFPDNDSAFKIYISKTPAEKINGISLSTTGATSDFDINGISIGGIGQVQRKVNGLSIAIFINVTSIMNGLQVGGFNINYKTNGIQIGFSNRNKITNGIQIGFFNESEHTKGFQIGLWNRNEKRNFPFINWNFKPSNEVK